MESVFYGFEKLNNMDNLLKKLEKEKDMALKHQHDNDHSWGYLDGIEKAIEIVKNYSIPAVVVRSEQVLCCCDNPNGFKEMEEGKETCSQCEKPY
jgi:hypothetical protein